MQDVIIIPLQLFGDHFYDMFDWLVKFSTGYWCADIVLSFFTGYLDRGVLVLDHRRIVCHYLKGWFFIDAPIAVTDVVLELGVSTSTGRASRFLRALRLIRIARLGKISQVRAGETVLGAPHRAQGHEA